MGELIRGRVLTFAGDPFHDGAGAARVEERGGVLMEGERIVAVGDARHLARAHPDARVTDMDGDLIVPGFVDAHVHYPQTGVVASWGKRLVDWLNTYTFPAEMRFGEAAHARATAELYLDLVIAAGTTSVASFCTSHPASVDAFFEAAAAREISVVAGKTCMDRNAPEGLCDTAASAREDSGRLLRRWHGTGRANYAITPRFAPTSTRAQLDGLGALWAENPHCAMQTHLAEQPEECAWVADLFPDARDYLDVYDRAGLLGPGAVFGHAIHLSDSERTRLADAGAAVAHCPTSNMFIGSGLCDVAGLKEAGVAVGLGTDIGGGSSFSMLATMAAAYEVGQLRGRALHPAELLWLATAGGADALRQGHRIGRIAPGYAADLVALDLAATPAIAQRHARANDLWEAIFPTIMMGDDRAVRAVWIAGARQRRPDRARREGA